MADNKTSYIALSWIKYPTAPEKSAFWCNGNGAEYLINLMKMFQIKKNIMIVS